MKKSNSEPKEERFNLRLSAESRAMLDALSKHLDLSRAGTVNQAIRCLWKREGLSLQSDRTQDTRGPYSADKPKQE
jgi:predicted DNA-binding protein